MVLQCGGPCLVPVVDMCNHMGQGGSAHLVWGQQHQGHRYLACFHTKPVQSMAFSKEMTFLLIETACMPKQ